MILMCWKSLLWCSTTDSVLNQMCIPLDALYSLRRIDLTIKYRQPSAALFQNVLRDGVRRLFHMQDYHIQTNGAGKEKMGQCMYTGLTITQSLMFAML